jgi:hypothetical protein
MPVGFFSQFSILVVNIFVMTIWGEDIVTKSKIDTFVASLLCSFFFLATVFIILGFLRNFLAITYSAIGGRPNDLPEEMVLHMKYRFVMGTLVGLSIVWTMAAFILGVRAHTVYSLVTLLVVAFFWCKIMIMYFAKNIKPSPSRRSMMAV